MNKAHRWLGAACACALVAWSVPTKASAFVCARTGQSSQDDASASGPATSWFVRDLTFTLQEDGTEQIDCEGEGPTCEDEFEVLAQSFEPWGIRINLDGDEVNSAPSNLGCGADQENATDLIFSQQPNTSSREVGYDFLDPSNNRNVIVFYDSDWPYTLAGGADDISTLALTTTTFNAATGEILDADIEFNTTFRTFSTGTPNNTQDLLNTAVHEVGHFIGLAHSTLEEATMAPTTTTNEIAKRDLDCDDLNGLALKYPAGEENGYCAGSADASCGFCLAPELINVDVDIEVLSATSEDGGCTGGGASSLPALLTVSFLGLLRRRRG